MTQSNSDTLLRLRDAVAGLPSGPKLIAALEQAADPSAAPVELITSVVTEAKANRGAENGGPPARLDLAGAASLVPALSFVAPRGKQDLAFFPDRFIVKTARADVVVPYTAVEHIIILDAIPKDTKGRVLLYLHISKSAGVMNGKKALTAVVIQVTASQELDIAHPTVPGERLAGAAAVVLCQAFGAALSPANVFAAPDAGTFTSAEGAAGVGAHVKASGGNLFPLPAGLCFLESPATFIPLPAIASVELARAGGASSTFDVYVHLRDGTTQEFSQISRQEVGAVEAYVRATGLALGPPADSGSDVDGEGAEGGEASDSDDPDDEDFNPLDDSDEEGAGKKKKKKKGAAAGGEAPAAKKARTEAAGEGDEGAAAAAVAGEGEGVQGDEEAEADSEDSDESEEEDESDSDSDGSVEMVSEDEFSMEALRSMMEEEKGGEKGAKGGAAGTAGGSAGA